MKLTCPACGAVTSLEAAANDAAARKVAALFGRLPPEVAAVVPPYLALFRPARQGLRWTRVETLLGELVPMVRDGFARSGRRCRPAASIWVDGLHQVANRDLRRPLKNHAYLQEVVLGLFEAADSRWETERDEARRQGRKAAPRPVAAEEPSARDRLKDLAEFHLETGVISRQEYEQRLAEIEQQAGGTG